MKIRFFLNFVSSFKRIVFLALVITFITESSSAFDYKTNADSPQKDVPSENARDWLKFSKRVDERREHDRVNGIAYIISGALILIGGSIGYNNTTDPLSKLAFTFSQGLGISGAGYGVYMYQVSGEDREFVDFVRRTHLLSLVQQDEITKNYLDVREEDKKSVAVIRAVAHGLVAGMTIYNASRESNPDLRNGLYIIGGVNALTALSFTF